jgi:hypothetical protein
MIIKYVGFVVLTPLAMKISIFWDITLCIPIKTDVSEKNITSIFRCFGCRLLRASFMLGLLFGPEDRAVVPPKRRLTYTGLHGFISQKIELYK